MTNRICALATPPGRSAVAVIRLSGEGTLAVLEEIFLPSFHSNSSLSKYHRRAVLGKIVEPGRTIDEVLILPFLAPHSYTGEESAEIHLHGNPVIVEQTFTLLFRHGFQAARPGEFTLRAFQNGKLDLTQAEAVHEIVEARNDYELQQALQQKEGSFRSELLRLRSELINLTADFTAELDFIEEDIQFLELSEKFNRIQSLQQSFEKILNLSKQKVRYREGYEIVIAGPPNAGKSTLLNTLLGENRAIVSDTPGTTRDFIESELSINGIQIRLIDTAGIRVATDDAIEKKGIEKSLEKAEMADLVLHVLDGSLPRPENLLVEGKKNLILVNKLDKLDDSWQQSEASWEKEAEQLFFLSLQTGERRQSFLESFYRIVGEENRHSEGFLLSSWQQEILERIQKELSDVFEFLKAEESPEMAVAALHNAVERIGELTGEVTTEDILGRIFSRFCIGK